MPPTLRSTISSPHQLTPPNSETWSWVRGFLGCHPYESSSSSDDTDYDDSDPHQVTDRLQPQSYDEHDEGPPTSPPDFKPRRQPGPHLTHDDMITRGGARNFIQAIDF
ncbi:hypothetical protein PoB_005599300 [Plakobranchus ocellatus]|uniref:Uncharacterized protein n=1 Tax=Plakobranchus ocellatus TaxID=259542 RepID=A0AAV4CEV0_9GAST|nr:hypothetical protein PoB_005599300 [Plakobranchus ocellatus]